MRQGGMSTPLAFSLLGSLGVLLLPSLLAEAAAPNVLFILADDMGQWAARLLRCGCVHACVCVCECVIIADMHGTYILLKVGLVRLWILVPQVVLCSEPGASQ